MNNIIQSLLYRIQKNTSGKITREGVDQLLIDLQTLTEIVKLVQSTAEQSFIKDSTGSFMAGQSDFTLKN